MQAADPIDRPAPVDRQVGHVETFRWVIRVLASQRQQIMQWDAELLLGIAAQDCWMSAGSKRSKPAGTAVWVVKRLPARVTANAARRAVRSLS